MDSLVAGGRNESASLRRSWMWLLAFVIFHLVAISRQVDVDGISLFERTALAFFAPIQNALSSTADAMVGAWSSFVDLRRVGEENELLKARLRAAEMQLLSQRAAVEENARLRVFLELKPRLPMATILADVVARNASPWFRTISIDKGSANGVLLGATVLSPSGVLGRVITVSPNSASVQLLVDRDSGAAVLTEKSRVDGIVSGFQDESDGSPLLLMKYVPSLATVTPGEVVVTSGLDQLFEKGLVVGTVLRVSEPVGLFKDVWVRPSASPAFAEQVFVSLVPRSREEAPPQ
ncbi:MAG: rod shape-determining protein MreC [Vicinamibacteria bacterium]|nr:rod shape-determining protein MreC [Vicinamibacteria bacterium]